MPPSPFHGIFSAFGQDTPKGTSDATGGFGFTEVDESSHDSDSKDHSRDFDSENRSRDSSIPAGSAASTKGQIAVDIYEQNGYYVVRAPIAGVSLNDLDIEVDEKVLTIRGIRKKTDDVPDDQHYVQECFWGEFARSITLPCIIDPKKVKATFSKDCILKVLIPKEEKVKIVRINEG